MTAAPDPGRAVVTAREAVAPGIVALTLRPARPAPPAPPGSHVDVTVPLPGGARTRSYSLVDRGEDDGLLRIAVRRDAAGRGGSLWMHTLAPGIELDVTGPHDTFGPSPGGRPALLLAAGIGVTPMLGLARALRARGDRYRVLYTGRSRSALAFADHLEAAHPGRVHIIETGREGRLDPDEVVASTPVDGVLYVCGPYGLLDVVRAAWARDGRPPGRLRFETFGTSGRPAGAFRAHVPGAGLTVDVPVGTSLLDALQAAGVELLFDCLSGECGLCRVRLLDVDGVVDHRDVFLSARQRALGEQMCACVSRIAGRAVTLEC